MACPSRRLHGADAVSGFGPSSQFVASENVVAIGGMADIGQRLGRMPR
jgi:hypothetical protein